MSEQLGDMTDLPAGNVDATDGDALWQAFCYVSGDMTAAETEQFEQRMLVEERLCDAVVQATRLTVSISGAPAGVATEPAVRVERISTTSPARPGHARRQHGNRATLASLAAVVACTGLLWAVWSLPTIEQDAMVSAVPDETAADVLDGDAEWIVSVWATESATDNDNIEELDGELEERLDVPDWLLTAVTITDVEPELLESDDMDL